LPINWNNGHATLSGFDRGGASWSYVRFPFGPAASGQTPVAIDVDGPHRWSRPVDDVARLRT
jgi:hypothetical protein